MNIRNSALHILVTKTLLVVRIVHHFDTFFTNSCTPWSRVLFEKVTVAQPVKKFPAFMEPKGSFPCSQHPAASPYPYALVSSLYAYQSKFYVYFSSLQCALHHLLHPPSLDHLKNMWVRGQITQLLIMQFPTAPLPLHPSYVQIFPSAPCSQTPSVCVLPLMWQTKFHTHTKQQVKLYFVYFKLYVFRQQTGRQEIVNCMAATIARI
jgi:hypothetical protein